MKQRTLPLTALLALVLLLEVATSDKVDCLRMTDSSYGHFVECQASKPMPLKVTATFQLDKDYLWQPYLSYTIYLVDANNRKTALGESHCFHGVPSYGNKTKGTNLTLSISCNQLPRELEKYDLIEYLILFGSSQDWLSFGIPLPGYNSQMLQVQESPVQSSHPFQDPVEDEIDVNSMNSLSVASNVSCIRLQDSNYAHYVSCDSQHPLPLKIETTIQLDMDYDWNEYLSFTVYLVDASNKKITFTSNCFNGIPSTGHKTKGTNLTLSVTCNKLPRELQQYDFVEYLFLFHSTNQWLSYGVPLPGYSTHSDIERTRDSFAESGERKSSSNIEYVEKDSQRVKFEEIIVTDN